MLEEHVRTRVNEKGIAVMGHIVCGYPSFEANWEILEEMDAAGVDVVEMQFPFSEPIADGPLFLTANQESLNNGTKIKDCFSIMKKASEKFSFKILMMGYYNTVFKNGEENFCRLLKENGASGMIVPDLPLEEAESLLQHCDTHELSFIRLIAPTNKEERIVELLNGAKGFVYAVARKGVTGQGTSFTNDMEQYFYLLKEKSQVPVAVGFGISQHSDIAYLTGKIDMAVIGTAVLKRYLKDGRKGVKDFFTALRGN
jgi:tryptophan synthase alpha chain